MPHVKLLEGVMNVAQASGDHWYVTNGSTSVGPITIELIARGVEAGKVPAASFVRHESWKVWRPLSDLAEIISDDEPEHETLKLYKSDMDRPSMEEIAMTGRPSSHGDSVPPTAEDNANERRDALLMLMTAAVARAHAEVAIVHEATDDGAIAVSAHGPQMFEALGLRTKLLDPALLAAAAGALVVAEPTPGPAGQAMIARLSRLGVAVTGAVMLPLRPNDRLFGTLEIGRRLPFRASEIAGLEALVDAFVAKLAAGSPLGKSAA